MTNRRRRPAGRPATASSSPRRSLLADARDGLRYCASRRWLWVAVASHGFISMIAIGPLFVLVPLLIEQVMGQSGAVLGLVIAAGGLGGVTGAILAGHIRVSRRRITAMWVSLGVAGMMVVALAAASNAWYAGLSFGLVWVFTTYANVLWSPILQEQIPADMLGRAASLEWMASFAGTPVGIIGAGLLAAAAGVRATLLGGGILAALVVLGLFVPGVRDPERAQSVLGQPTALDRTL
jgi:predicted MFS family arabinose efflux permease